MSVSDGTTDLSSSSRLAPSRCRRLSGGRLREQTTDEVCVSSRASFRD